MTKSYGTNHLIKYFLYGHNNNDSSINQFYAFDTFFHFITEVSIFNTIHSAANNTNNLTQRNLFIILLQIYPHLFITDGMWLNHILKICESQHFNYSLINLNLNNDKIGVDLQKMNIEYEVENKNKKINNDKTKGNNQKLNNNNNRVGCGRSFICE